MNGRASRVWRLDADAGASAVEYSLLIALVAAVIVGVVALIGPKLVPGFVQVISVLP